MSFLVLRTDNRKMIIDVLGAWISAVLTTVASRVQLALPDRSSCVAPDNDEDGEEKLKPARRSRGPAKPADPKFSKAKRAFDNDESDAATPTSDKDEKVKPARTGRKPKVTAPAHKSRAPAKKTPNHDSDADVEAPLSTNLASVLKPQHLPRHVRKGRIDLRPMPVPSALST